LGVTYDTFADDLAALFHALGLQDVALLGFSMGGGEVARYIGRHGTSRIAKAGLISAVPPLMLRTPQNSGGTPLAAFDGIRAGVRADRSQFFKDVSVAFFGANREGAKVSQGTLDWFWYMAMQASIKGTLDCVKAFSETDFTADLKQFDRPTLIIHGDDDQIVPIGASGLASAKLIERATLKVYPGAPHGLTITEKDKVNADLLAFLKA
jgi:non-heme chloroperoxidase